MSKAKLSKLGGTLKRWGQMTIAVLYVGVLVGLPVVDAAIEAAARSNETHIESESDGLHSVVHDEYLCQLCRVIELTGARPTTSRIDFEETAHHRDAIAALPAHPRSATPTPLIPRAPPSL